MFNAKKFGLAAGILWGGSLFVFTIISILTGYGTDFFTILKSIYPGYSITFLGSIIGLIYGFLDGFIGFYIFAWLYNKLLEKK